MMEEIKIRSDNRIPVGANIRRIRIEKKVKASSIVLDLQLQGCNINLSLIHISEPTRPY